MDHLDLIHETADRKAAVPVLLRTPTRETRHFDCKCCGHLLYEWNNSQDHDFFLVEQPADD